MFFYSFYAMTTIISYNSSIAKMFIFITHNFSIFN